VIARDNNFCNSLLDQMLLAVLTCIGAAAIPTVGPLADHVTVEYHNVSALDPSDPKLVRNRCTPAPTSDARGGGQREKGCGDG
jgi:hypothetical protein